LFDIGAQQFVGVFLGGLDGFGRGRLGGEDCLDLVFHCLADGDGVVGVEPRDGVLQPVERDLRVGVLLQIFAFD